MAERIVIEGTEARLTCDGGQSHVLPVPEFSRVVTESTVYGMQDEPLADNVKWAIHCGHLTVIIVEFKPEVRLVKWVTAASPARYGPEAVYSNRRLATPYVVLKVPFRSGRVMPRVEVFYRNEPLSSLEGPGGELFFPNLLNVSPVSHGCISWFCTQYLDRAEPTVGIAQGLNGVSHHLWGGAFNESSEAHEGKSGFSLTAERRIDPRVTNIDRWEAESSKDPRFVLGVNWLTTAHTVRQLLEMEWAVHALAPAPRDAKTLGNIMLRWSQKPQSNGTTKKN
jgi:hypothetical protein